MFTYEPTMQFSINMTLAEKCGGFSQLFTCATM